MEAERKRVFNSQDEEKEQKVESEPYPHCGCKGHEESMCPIPYESVRAWQNKPKQQWRAKTERKVAVAE